MWPKRNTAFVVIHGAGAHRPFATLDKFARGFRNVLKRSNRDLDVWWRHGLQRHEDWIEHYVSLEPEGKARLDFFEYYWDCYMDHQVDISEVRKWLDQVSESAGKFYAARPDLSKKHEQSGSDLFQDGEFKVGGYFLLLGWAGRILRSLQRLGIARIPVISTAITWLLNWGSNLMAKMMGDVVIYTTADVRSGNYAIRQNLLAGAVETLRFLLDREDYDQIVVVGHSLGSVIAYDALNRIVLDMNAQGGIGQDKAQKIAGLVTCGSPLDKVAFFFREHTRDEEFVRQQVLAHLHGFRRRPFPGEDVRIDIWNPIQRHLDKARWLNFYHLKDPVSGHLDAYDVDRNILCDVPAEGAAEAHSAYWTCDQMYQEIGAEFFKSALDAFLA
jgi:pimeloyl-ACP methyl ester carboxylesterase